MKSLLLLGAVFFGAEAESQDVQKLLAYARQLNQSLGSLAHHGESAARARRLQVTLAPMPSGCPEACDGIQCAYDDSQAIIDQMNGGDPMVAITAAGDIFGSICLHRTAMTCAVSSTECANVVEGSNLDLAPCLCDACPNFPKIYEGMGPLMTALQLMASGGTPTAEQLDSLLEALCPMSSVLECLDSNSACSSALAAMGSLGSSLEGLATMKSQCATYGKATSYSTTYSFTSPTCTAMEKDGAGGLLLNLLAGSFSLLSFLN